jgi:hypothetical protein
MFALFYDLETTDKNCVGQILNYSFILVNDHLEPVDEISELVKISRLQLPDPGAILANRTDVVLHQQKAVWDEYDSMRRIDAFIRRSIDRAKGSLGFVGYNSARFDQQYLRTSLIRNGLDPYYGKSLQYRDLLHAVQKVYTTSSEFRELIVKQRGTEKRLSLSLQTIAKALDLLEGEQAHESREDVLLTVRVAKVLKERFGLDICTFHCYEGHNLHATARSGAVYLAEAPEYDLSSHESVVRTPLTLLETDYRASLWINVNRYMEKPDGNAVMYRAFANAPLFISKQAVRDPLLEKAARSAVAHYKGVNLRNFFERSTCDIEMDIYRVDAADRKALTEALESGSKAPLAKCSGEDAKKLWVRSQLARMKDLLSDPKAREMLHKYATYRYGGKLQLVRKLPDSPLPTPEDPAHRLHHITLDEMVRELALLKQGAEIAGRSADLQLLEALEVFYKNSDIFKVAACDLLTPQSCARYDVAHQKM